MNSTTVRARLVMALLLIAVSFSVALVAPGATAAPAYTVNLTVSDTRPDVGQAVRLSGKVTPAAPGKRVRVQGKAPGTGWVTISRPVLSKNSTYKATLRFNRAGRVAIRVVKPASSKVAEGVSRVRYLRVGDRPSAPVIVTTTLPNGSVGSAYSATVATADRRPGAFSIGSGSLPAGLTIDAQDGEIKGTPTTEGTSSFTVVFRDPDGLSDSQPLSLTVGPATPAPVISTTTLPNGEVAVPYSTQLQTVDNKTGTWSITAGALPAGLTGNPTTGVISGTPTTAGTKSFTVKFTETATGLSDTQALSITVAAATAPVIATTSVPNGAVGAAYNTKLLVNGNKSGTWAVTAGSLPAGLALASATGVISGTPTTVGTKNFTVKFTQTGGLTDSQALTLTVESADAPVITTTTLPDGTVGSAYAATLQTQGNKTGTWSLVAGSLPAGLTLKTTPNITSGAITGTPTTVGTFSFSVRFTALNGLTDTQALSIQVVAAP